MASASQRQNKEVAWQLLQSIYGETGLSQFSAKRSGPGRVLGDARRRVYELSGDSETARRSSLDELSTYLFENGSFSESLPVANLANRVTEMRLMWSRAGVGAKVGEAPIASVREMFGEFPMKGDGTATNDVAAVRYLDGLFRTIGIDPVHETQGPLGR